MAWMAFLSCLREGWGQGDVRPADDTSWVMKLTVVCLVLTAMSGFVAGWRMRNWWLRVADAGPAAPVALAVAPAAVVAVAAAATVTTTSPSRRD